MKKKHWKGLFRQVGDKLRTAGFELEQASRELREKQEFIDQLREENARLREEMVMDDAVNNKIRSMTSSEAYEHIGTLQKQITVLRNVIDELEPENFRMQEQISELEDALDAKVAQLVLKNRVVSELQEELDDSVPLHLFDSIQARAHMLQRKLNKIRQETEE